MTTIEYMEAEQYSSQIAQYEALYPELYVKEQINFVVASEEDE